MQLPIELVWMNPPKRHDSAPPSRLLLCFHPGTGALDSLTELVLHINEPCLGLRLTSRTIQVCRNAADIEQRYWELCHKEVRLWRDGIDVRWLLGSSFGCRVAFSFARRFDEAGCADIRVVLLDGRIADQPFYTVSASDTIADTLLPTLAEVHGDEAASNMADFTRLCGEPLGNDWYQTRCGAVSERVHVLYTASSEPMGLVRVQELAANTVEVEHIGGLHIEMLQAISHGERAHAMATRIKEFLLRDVQ
jgi:thioesterase domain-containing protein